MNTLFKTFLSLLLLSFGFRRGLKKEALLELPLLNYYWTITVVGRGLVKAHFSENARSTVCLKTWIPLNPCSHTVEYLPPIGRDSDAITHRRWHVYWCLVCYCYSPNFQLPTSLLTGYWLNRTLNMHGARWWSCNLIWKGDELIRSWAWSHLYLAVDRDGIFALAPWGLPEVCFPQKAISL